MDEISAMEDAGGSLLAKACPMGAAEQPSNSLILR
jgi:hypothetical protein